jgi:hypothetical protein
MRSGAGVRGLVRARDGDAGDAALDGVEQAGQARFVGGIVGAGGEELDEVLEGRQDLRVGAGGRIRGLVDECLLDEGVQELLSLFVGCSGGGRPREEEWEVSGGRRREASWRL